MNNIIEKLNFSIDIDELRDYYNTVKTDFDHLIWSWERCGDTVVKQWRDAAYADPANLLTYGWAIQSNLKDITIPCPPWNISTYETTEYRNTELAFGIIEKLQKEIPHAYRWAISVQPPGGIVSVHSDQEDEYTVWIPVHTEGVVITFVTPEKTSEFSLESNGSAYLLDTTIPHHTHNAGNIDRVSIIFRINQKYVSELKTKVLSYLPVDIPVDLPCEQQIVDWFDNHKVEDADYWEYEENRHTWAIVAARKNLDNWRKIDFDLWNTRRNLQENPELYFHPGFEEQFPSLVSAIKQLPFKQITYAGMLSQMGAIAAHQDTYDENNPLEPRRYNIYLTDPAYNTFYMCKEENSERAFPQIDNTYRCFAFNNTEVWHGAEPTHRTKIMIAITGIIDDDANQELVKRSLEKFKGKALYL
jgi:hypothetical protein